VLVVVGAGDDVDDVEDGGVLRAGGLEDGGVVVEAGADLGVEQARLDGGGGDGGGDADRGGAAGDARSGGGGERDGDLARVAGGPLERELEGEGGALERDLGGDQAGRGGLPGQLERLGGGGGAVDGVVELGADARADGEDMEGTVDVEVDQLRFAARGLVGGDEADVQGDAVAAGGVGGVGVDRGGQEAAHVGEVEPGAGGLGERERSAAVGGRGVEELGDGDVGDLAGDGSVVVLGLGWAGGRGGAGLADGLGGELAGEVEGCAAAGEAFGPAGAAGGGGRV
jgi:hypothetical protein